ncbi:hypothetical protein BN948_00166 [Hydrogenophaga intermedia]|uniref:Uncharacterized protein n=1 Tax=Hydrogenophaga intermedia TaxID=65786 RepID=A0A1L1PCQ4_HYDIT|nr:hypothetical protein [Hydrogenophaga intermedia]CDN85773.1 hypothetical protein BN948_00166 [Hydrogenophaga intermedia]
MSFWNTLTEILDIAMAPSCAQEPASDASQADISWHNAYGTAADYQVPAESHDAYPSAMDNGYHCGGGFDSGMGY